MTAPAWRPPRGTRAADPRDPRETTGRLIIGRLIVDPCPFCEERHRHRFRGWGAHYEAHCGGNGGYVVTEQERA